MSAAGADILGADYLGGMGLAMDEGKALDIVMKHMDGLDPRAGNELPPESPYQHPDTIRALFMAVLVLKYQQKHKNKDPGDAGGAPKGS